VPFRRDHVLGGDRVHRTRLNARVAVDALLGVDVELIRLLETRFVGRRVDAVNRQTSTQEVSFVPMQGSLITYAKGTLPTSIFTNAL
jgi:hypothetical protein